MLPITSLVNTMIYVILEEYREYVGTKKAVIKRTKTGGGATAMTKAQGDRIEAKLDQIMEIPLSMDMPVLHDQSEGQDDAE